MLLTTGKRGIDFLINLEGAGYQGLIIHAVGEIDHFQRKRLLNYWVIGELFFIDAIAWISNLV